ncbi:UNVERIFIED_CONTAM: tdc-1 [Trichonephila clavipes]
MTRAVNTIESTMLTRVEHELHSRIDVGRVTKVSYIEHIFLFSELNEEQIIAFILKFKINTFISYNDYHWGIPLSRRFRSLKLWFVIRKYGVEGLQKYIREHVRLAKKFESLVQKDDRFVVANQVHFGLVCFRLKGSNNLNQKILSSINASGKLHMVPASLSGNYVIRFCVCAQHATDADIVHAWDVIMMFTEELLEIMKVDMKEEIVIGTVMRTLGVGAKQSECPFVLLL